MWLAENAKRAARGDHIRRAQGGPACSSLCRRAGRHGPARSERVAPAGRRHASTHTDCCETRPWTERRTRGHAVAPRRAKADLAASLAWTSATKERDDAAVAPSARRSRPPPARRSVDTGGRPVAARGHHAALVRQPRAHARHVLAALPPAGHDQDVDVHDPVQAGRLRRHQVQPGPGQGHALQALPRPHGPGLQRHQARGRRPRGQAGQRPHHQQAPQRARGARDPLEVPRRPQGPRGAERGAQEGGARGRRARGAQAATGAAQGRLHDRAARGGHDDPAHPLLGPLLRRRG
mmetsp:Transcript_20599/g.53609  ORF Transcript_20599/g.53609 Transcript_20599/m.53609 type:complete len:293 (-) Transcript_20599:31-909(-)